jgi:hypothetical protein
MDSVQAHGLARRVVVGVVAGALGTVGAVLGAAALPAHAATAHRAAVVVEVDGVIHTAKITFSTDSISGLDALRSGGFNPHVRVFGGNGGAVCALDVGSSTIGCPADTSCLTCAQPAYWAYFRALAGATKYTYSVIGAGNAQVHDGDVEAWAWGTGSPPSPFVSFRDVWGPDTTTTRPPVTHPPTTRMTGPPTAPATIGGLGSTTTIPSITVPTSSPSTNPGATAKQPSTTTASRSTSSTSRSGPTDRGTETTGGDRKIATAPVVARGGGGSPLGLIGFGVILATLVGAIVYARRRRSLAERP